MWGNSANQAAEQFISLYSDRSNNSDHRRLLALQLELFERWGYCGTAFNGLGSTWDQSANVFHWIQVH